MDSSHSKVRRFECKFCLKSFFWKHHLKRHHSSCQQAKLSGARAPVMAPAGAWEGELSREGAGGGGTPESGSDLAPLLNGD